MPHSAEVFKIVPRRRKGISAHRLTCAFKVRDAARALVRARGEWETCRNVQGKFLSADVGDFKILHHTPFTRLPSASESVKYQAALDGRPVNRAYGVNVWIEGKGKVFLVEWDNDADLEVATFHRGEWEEELLALAQGPVDGGRRVVVGR